ncbi:selenide, water dikinase SelD [Alkalibacter saccharofermentans]|uniref:Selenide, water dikinase n=1 Tax=Alkalibacter saccharofermentans DSM 14828 TaxID=1120975 RepID=A0A1M4Z4M8_9FIRM|nr:selenide, water dikinase SelD [Alkalibacter saccharofermentans]SHF12908.1 selenophosphate synthase [Alkalibacter saccharofermentans DSM 14828]
MDDIKLTEYSHGAGCGCKISPEILESILEGSKSSLEFPKLLVGNSSKDDAAAFDLGNGTSVLSTTDFFMPIVDDPYTFGKIAATNAISDIYAMGGKPLMAISIFGWPIKKLPVDVARQVIAGGKSVCENAGIPLAGGHSIDSPEPIFGLAVTGLVENINLKKNNSATEGCELFLTKPLGIGILTTAQKRKKIAAKDLSQAIDAMCTLNSIGEDIAKIKGVKALTDVTGFGLLGHLTEICEGSDISAVVDFEKVSLLDNTLKYLSMGCTPGGTRNNFASYGHKISPLTEDQMNILCDPQTSGGLLVAVEKDSVEEFLNVTKNAGLHLDSIGITVPKSNHFVKVV